MLCLFRQIFSVEKGFFYFFGWAAGRGRSKRGKNGGTKPKRECISSPFSAKDKGEGYTKPTHRTYQETEACVMLQTKPRSGTVTAVIAGELDHFAAPQIRRMLDEVGADLGREPVSHAVNLIGCHSADIAGRPRAPASPGGCLLTSKPIIGRPKMM